MAVNRHIVLLFLAFFYGNAAAQNVTDVLKYVDPLIGSANGGMCIECTASTDTDYLGNVFTGATLPYGEYRGPIST